MKRFSWMGWYWITAIAVSGLVLPIGEAAAGQLGDPIVAQVSATVKARTVVGLKSISDVEGGSVATNPGVIEFRTYDDEDIKDGTGDPTMMYAPVRSKTGKNWHVLDILTNVPFNLTATVSGVVGGVQLRDRLYGWNGGFWDRRNGTKVAAGDSEDSDPKTDDWKLLDGRKYSVGKAFNGVVPFNYRLDVAGIPAGAYAGTVTYTLTTQ